MDYLGRRYRVGSLWFLCAFAMALGACERPDPKAELDAAAASFSAGNYDDAALRLNYVVQLEPNNIRARELRGDVALQLGDYANAANEFVRARDLGAPSDTIALRLTEAYVSQGLTNKALGLLAQAEKGLGSEPLYWALQAEALLAEGRLPEAERSLEEAARVGDGGSRTLTVAAQVAFARGNPESAFELLEQALVIAPNDPRVHIARAELLARTDQLAEAAAEMRRATDLYREASVASRETMSLLGLIQIHLARNDLGAAEEVAARLAQQAPDVQWTAYFQGIVKFRRGHFDEAAVLIQPLVNASPENIQYRSLLGAIQLARGNVGQAEQQFLRVLAVSPRDPAAAKLLAEARLRQQRPDAALEALLAVQDTAAEDPQIGLLSGIATLLSGNAEQGIVYLEEAASMDPTNELLKLQLARAYLATGRDADATSLLAGSFGDDAFAIEASLLRLFAESRGGDAGSAADIARTLEEEHADDPRVLTVLAVHYQLNGEADRARGLFERVAEFDTQDSTARLFVAASLVREGRQDDAELLLRQLIQQQPANSRALAGLAQLLANRGEIDEAADLFGRAAAHTTSVFPVVAIVQLRLRQGDVAEAKRQLGKAANSAPDNPEVIALYGIIALVEGRTDDAVESLERAMQLLPDRLGVTLALARARLAQGQTAVARDSLLRALEVAPQSYAIRLALGDAELQGGNTEGALSVATNLKVAFPSQAGGYVLEGRSLLAERQYGAASRSLAIAYERKPTWRILALHIQALRLAGHSAEALVANDAWLTDQPDHVPAGLMRAVLLQAEGRIQEALEAYKAVLKLEPENLAALNNAAWISYELVEPGALSFAERAYQAGPENAAVLDTYGWILLGQSQVETSIEVLSRAADLAPHAPEIRYHLAEALVAGGQSARAQKILESLLTEVRDFGDRAAAERLLQSTHTEVALGHESS